MVRYIDALVLLLLLQFESECMAELLTTSPVTLEEGATADFIFESDNKKPIEDCRFTVPGFATPIKIYSGFKTEKYEFVGEGFSKGQCGLKLLSVKRSNAGKVNCSLVLSDITEQKFEKEMKVLYPIENLRIVSNSKDGLYEYTENDVMEFSCTAEGGSPAPTLSLSIGGKEITRGISKSEQQVVELNWTVPAEAEHHNQVVLCRAEQKHSQPDWSNTKDETRKLTVSFSPRLENSTEDTVDVGVVFGKNANVTVRILSHPKPYSYELTKNGTAVETTFQEANNEGITEYTWVMSNVSQKDMKYDWKLIVANDINKTSIPIQLIPPIDPSADDSTDSGNGVYYTILGILVICAGLCCCIKKRNYLKKLLQDYCNR